MEINAVFPFARSLSLSIILCTAPGAQAAVVIEHDEIDEARSGERIAVDAQVSASADDGDSVSEVRTYFRADNDGRWHFVPMQGSGSDYQGVLPAPDIHTDIVRYQLLAITSARNLVKSEIFNIEIEKDENNLARLNRKAPRDIKIDVSELQDAKDIYDELELGDRISSSDKQNIAREAGEPNPDSRVDVRSEYNPVSDSITGFNDYINLSYVPGAAGYGVAAGVVSEAASVAGAPTAGAVSTAAAAGGGLSAGWLLGGVALVGGGAAVAASGGGGGGDDGPAGPGGISVFAGRWTGPQVCAATGDAAFRWVLDLNQTGDAVTGIVAFHECPGGGRAVYNLTGTATTATSVQMDGTFASGQGPLGGTAPASQTFTVTFGQAPNPNFAP